MKISMHVLEFFAGLPKDMIADRRRFRLAAYRYFGDKPSEFYLDRLQRSVEHYRTSGEALDLPRDPPAKKKLYICPNCYYRFRK